MRPIPVFLEALCLFEEWRGLAYVTVCGGGGGELKQKKCPFVTLMFREMQKPKSQNSSFGLTLYQISI